MFSERDKLIAKIQRRVDRYLERLLKECPSDIKVLHATLGICSDNPQKGSVALEFYEER